MQSEVANGTQMCPGVATVDEDVSRLGGGSGRPEASVPRAATIRL